MNARRLRPWLPLAALAAAVAVLAALRLLRPSTADKPDGPRPPIFTAASPLANAAFLRDYLHAAHVEAAVVPCPDRPGAWYVVAPGADASAVRGLPAAPEYADCWRGVLLAEAEAEGRAAGGPYEVQAGSFHFFGDGSMVGRIREWLEHPTGQ